MAGERASEDAGKDAHGSRLARFPAWYEAIPLAALLQAMQPIGVLVTTVTACAAPHEPRSIEARAPREQRTKLTWKTKACE